MRSLREKPSLEEVLAAAPAKRTAQRAEPFAATNIEAAHPGKRKWIWAGAALGVVALFAVFAASRGRRNEAGVTGRRLVVLPMENETGDPKFDYIAAGVAEGVAQRLQGIGGITIRSGAFRPPSNCRFSIFFVFFLVFSATSGADQQGEPRNADCREDSSGPSRSRTIPDDRSQARSIAPDDR